MSRTDNLGSAPAKLATACAAGSLTFVAAFGMPVSAQASQTVQCTGALTGTFEKVIVPPNEFCELSDSTVNGDVTAHQNSRLHMANNDVEGNVTGQNATGVILDGDVVHGHVAITGHHDPVFLSAAVLNTTVINGDIRISRGTNSGSDAAGDWTVQDNTLQEGSIRIEENDASFPSAVSFNSVADDIEVRRNTGNADKEVSDNTVGDRLACFENQAPFTAANNVAARFEGQCVPTTTTGTTSSGDTSRNVGSSNDPMGSSKYSKR